MHALAWPLLTGADGTKLGKTTGARLWLDPAMTSPYQFRRRWRSGCSSMTPSSSSSSRSSRCGRSRDIEEILATHAAAPERRVGQRALADEVTSIVHGPDAARATAEAADVLFGGDPLGASIEALETLAGEVLASRPGSTRPTSSISSSRTGVVSLEE